MAPYTDMAPSAKLLRNDSLAVHIGYLTCLVVVVALNLLRTKPAQQSTQSLAAEPVRIRTSAGTIFLAEIVQ